MKKKLLITASTFPRWENDTEPRFILDYAKEMNKYYNVTVLVPSFPGAIPEEELEGVHIIRYRYFPVNKLETLCYPGAIVPRIREKKLRLLLVPFLLISLWFYLLRHHKNYDLIHAHWLIPQGIIQSCFKTPYLLTGHGGDVTSLNRGIMKTLKRRSIKNAKAVTVVSKRLQEELQNICPGTKTNIIPMGCNTEMFSAQYRVENYFKQSEKKVVLFVGRLAEKKGVKYLIDAMAEVDALLVIVGDGTEKESLVKQAQKYGNKIVFAGSKSHKELRTIYPSADVFVAPSIVASDGDEEGFGLVILEAMASGLPVIASNSGGIVDIIENGKNGLLCQEKNSKSIAEQINRVLHDKELCCRIKKGSEETVNKYSYANIAFEYAELCKKALEE